LVAEFSVPARILPAMCPSLVQDAFLGQALKEWQPVESKGPISDGYVTFGEPLIYRIPKEQLVGTDKVSITVSFFFVKLSSHSTVKKSLIFSV